MTDNLYADDKIDSQVISDGLSKQEYDLFRKRYRQLSEEEIKLHDAIKDKANELAAQILRIPNPSSVDGVANKILAINHLEDAVYRAIKALTA